MYIDRITREKHRIQGLALQVMIFKTTLKYIQVSNLSYHQIRLNSLYFRRGSIKFCKGFSPSYELFY